VTQGRVLKPPVADPIKPIFFANKEFFRFFAGKLVFVTYSKN